jgi:hypothetical protein
MTKQPRELMWRCAACGIEGIGTQRRCDCVINIVIRNNVVVWETDAPHRQPPDPHSEWIEPAEEQRDDNAPMPSGWWVVPSVLAGMAIWFCVVLALI